MTRQIALLRGINVGANSRVAMADLRALLSGAGYEDVNTLGQSGNVVGVVVTARNWNTVTKLLALAQAPSNRVA